jgi:hypothetical protein
MKREELFTTRDTSGEAKQSKILGLHRGMDINGRIKEKRRK